MVREVHITRLRGIKQGSLTDLAPLTVLVGPNGCGKSTVLDAINIGAGHRPLDAVGQAVTRRQGVRHGAPWLLWRQGADGPAFVVAVADSGYARASELTAPKSGAMATAYVYDEWRIASPSDTDVRKSWISRAAWREGSSPAHQSKRNRIEFQIGAPYRTAQVRDQLNGVAEVKLVEPASYREDRPLHRLYSEASAAGRRSEVTKLIKGLVPKLDLLEILTEPDDTPILHLVYPDQSVPVALAGDGIVALVRAALELASAKDGVVLLEEPEAHQHPGAIVETAAAIHAAVERSIQVIVSTHSLDVLDALLSQAPDGFDFGRLAAYRMNISDGILRTQRIAGPDVRFSRERIGEDLR